MILEIPKQMQPTTDVRSTFIILGIFLAIPNNDKNEKTGAVKSGYLGDIFSYDGALMCPYGVVVGGSLTRTLA